VNFRRPSLRRLGSRERTIIGSVSYRNRYWAYCIKSYRLLLYGRILRALLQVQQLLKGRITQDDQRAVATRHPPRANAVDRPRYGRGLKGAGVRMLTVTLQPLIRPTCHTPALQPTYSRLQSQEVNKIFPSLSSHCLQF